MLSAKDITKKAKSNLAFAFVCLPKQRKADMMTFYAFCRTIDDIADEATATPQQRHQQLDQWAKILTCNDIEGQPLQQSIRELRDRYCIDTKHFTDIIEGCRSDIDEPPRYGSWEELQQYCYRVASCVGLISIKIFGCKNEQSETYAIQLGYALQLTNILRDVGEDLENGNRIYLPHTEMVRFQYSERDLVGRVYDGRFIAMMEYHAQRAEHLYNEALKCLTKEDRKALRPAESMRKIYFEILTKMRRDKFRVFEKKYTISKWKKLYHILS